jgi:hypothetical protein
MLVLEPIFEADLPPEQVRLPSWAQRACGHLPPITAMP